MHAFLHRHGCRVQQIMEMRYVRRTREAAARRPKLEKTTLAQVDLDNDVVDGRDDERKRARVCRVGVMLGVSSATWRAPCPTHSVDRL